MPSRYEAQNANPPSIELVIKLFQFALLVDSVLINSGNDVLIEHER